jgi:hypothetical protein
MLGTGARKVLVAMAVLLFIANTSLAGEAEDAVELLKLSFKCPRRAVLGAPWHHISRYIGDSKTFSMIVNARLQVKYPVMVETTTTTTGKYRDLKIEACSWCGTQELGLVCRKERCLQVIKVYNRSVGFGNNDKNDHKVVRSGDNDTVAYLCDRETLENVKLAVGLLILLNRTEGNE